MQPFTFKSATDTSSAINLLKQDPSSKILAGGTNLIDLMKMYVETPSQIVDIADIKLNAIETLPDGGLKIGALVSNNDLAYNPIVQQKYTMLSQALLSGASAQLRNMATLGGNILQRTRCPYFFNTGFACNKRDPGSGCSAINGFNRSHAVLGTSDFCIATHPSDMCVALVALDASVILTGPSGDRIIPFTKFHLLPGSTPSKESVIHHDELITAVILPHVSYGNNSMYLKVRDRASFEFALTSAAVALEINNNKISNARVALGGVGTKPWRSFEAEHILINSKNDISVYQKAADAALAGAKAYKFNAFKIELAKRTLVRALKTIGGVS